MIYDVLIPSIDFIFALSCVNGKFLNGFKHVLYVEGFVT